MATLIALVFAYVFVGLVYGNYVYYALVGQIASTAFLLRF